MAELDLKRLKEDPIYFAQEVLGLTLHESQREVLRTSERFIAVRAARRWGKSFLFSAYAAWAACVNPEHNIICISKSQRQSSEMFMKIKGIIGASALANSITRETQTELEFSNGSKIRSLPGGNPASLRGLTENLILVDEAAFVPDEAFHVLYPMLISTQGTMVLISTPNFSSGEFFRACQDESEYKAYHYTHDDAVFEDGSPLVPREELTREMLRCGGAESLGWQREYLAEFVQAEGAFFNLEALEDALDEDINQLSVGLPDHKYVIGADLGMSQDYTVFVVLDCTDPEALEVVYTERFHGKSNDQIMYRIYDTASRFTAQKVLIDNARNGEPLIEQLRNKYPRMPWQGFNFNRSTKPRLMTNLNIILERRHLIIPDDDTIRKEMISFYYEENPNTKHVKMGGKGAHDDYPIALALSVEAAEVFKPEGTIGLAMAGRGIVTGVPKARQNNYNAGRRVLT